MDGDFVAIISTYVDDYLGACTDSKWWLDFKNTFSAKFIVTDLGVLDHLLQMSVEW
jgi:hypothetical protein